MVKFIFGRELTEEEEFFDRDEEVRTLINYIENRQPAAIIAPRRIGKSSLLNFVKLKVSDKYIVAKLSLEGITSVEEFGDELNRKLILDSLAKSLKLRIKFNLTNVLDSLNQFLGSIKSIGVKLNNLEVYIERYSLFKQERLKPNEVLDDILLLPQRTAEDLNKRVVIMIDEFQKIRYLKQPFPRILEMMRKRFQESDLVEVIISGSEVGLIEEMLENPKEPFYNFFKIERLRPFDKETSIRFLDEGLKGRCRDLYERGYEITKGFPAWLNLFGLVLEKECSIDAFFNDPNVEIELRRDLDGLTRNELKVLKGLAQGQRISQIQVSNPYRVINSLRNKGLIEKSLTQYCLIT